MAYPKGAPRPPGSGRKKGTLNKINANMKAVFEQVFDRMGGAEWLYQWASNPVNHSDFVTMLSKLFPKNIDVTSDGEGIRIMVVTGVPKQEQKADADRAR